MHMHVCVSWMLIGQQSDKHCCLLDMHLLVTMALRADFTAAVPSPMHILTA